MSSQSPHHPQEVLLAQFSLYVHKGDLKPDSFHFVFLSLWSSLFIKLPLVDESAKSDKISAVPHSVWLWTRVPLSGYAFAIYLSKNNVPANASCYTGFHSQLGQEIVNAIVHLSSLVPQTVQSWRHGAQAGEALPLYCSAKPKGSICLLVK